MNNSNATQAKTLVLGGTANRYTHYRTTNTTWHPGKDRLAWRRAQVRLGGFVTKVG